MVLVNESTFVEFETSTLKPAKLLVCFYYPMEKDVLAYYCWRDLVTFTLLVTSPVSGCIINNHVLQKKKK